uniref:Nucleolar protein 7 n=1 Tax=Sus scrofa TaxID=9823 RepID=A0A8D1VMU9_PIG
MMSLTTRPRRSSLSPAPRRKQKKKSGEFGRLCAGSEPAAWRGETPLPFPLVPARSDFSTVSFRDKTLLKEKRKRREELFIEQKKRKLLPDTILDKLTAASQTDLKKSPVKLKEVKLQKKNEECEQGSDSKKAKVRKVQTVGQNKSYLALRLKDQDLRDSRQQAAKAFIQNCLYGPGTNRTTVNKFLSLDNKRLPVKKAAAQFLNHAWGSQKKQNAKRFKRRWMVRKMKTSK